MIMKSSECGENDFEVQVGVHIRALRSHSARSLRLKLGTLEDGDCPEQAAFRTAIERLLRATVEEE
jgi:hypothetical protein